MINATPPQIPNYSDDVESAAGPSYLSAEPGSTPTLRTFARQWYMFFNGVRNFLVTLRNAPELIEQPALATFSKRLGKNQTGVQVWIATYNHMLRWSGSKWEFAPGDTGSDYYVTGTGAGLSAGWVRADGSTVTYLLPDGSTAQRVLNTAANTWFRI